MPFIIHCMPSPSTPCLFLLCLKTTSAPITSCPLRSAKVPFVCSTPSSTLTVTPSRASRGWLLDTLLLRCVVPFTRFNLSDAETAEGPGDSVADPSVSFLFFLNFGRDARRLKGASASEADLNAVRSPKFFMTSLGSSWSMARSSSLSFSN